MIEDLYVKEAGAGVARGCSIWVVDDLTYLRMTRKTYENVC